MTDPFAESLPPLVPAPPSAFYALEPEEEGTGVDGAPPFYTITSNARPATDPTDCAARAEALVTSEAFMQAAQEFDTVVMERLIRDALSQLTEERNRLEKALALERQASAALHAMCKRMLSFGETAVRAGLCNFPPDVEDSIVRNHTDLKALRELLAALYGTNDTANDRAA